MLDNEDTIENIQLREDEWATLNYLVIDFPLDPNWSDLTLIRN